MRKSGPRLRRPPSSAAPPNSTKPQQPINAPGLSHCLNPQDHSNSSTAAPSLAPTYARHQSSYTAQAARDTATRRNARGKPAATTATRYWPNTSQVSACGPPAALTAMAPFQLDTTTVQQHHA